MDQQERTLQDLLNPRIPNTYYLYIPFPKSTSAFRVIEFFATKLEASRKDKFVFHAEPRVVRITGKESHLLDLQQEFPSIKVQNQNLPVHSSNDPRRKRKKRFKLAIYGIDDTEVKKWESFLGVSLMRETRSGITLGNFTVELETIIPSIQRAILEENVDRICLMKPVNFCPKCLAFIWKKNGERMCRCSDTLAPPLLVKRKPGRPPGSKTMAKTVQTPTNSNSSTLSTSNNLPDKPTLSSSSVAPAVEAKSSSTDPPRVASDGATSSKTQNDDDLIHPSSPRPAPIKGKGSREEIDLSGLFAAGSRPKRISSETRQELLDAVLQPKNKTAQAPTISISLPPPKPEAKTKGSKRKK